jgi:hypothetical protein
MCTVYLDDCDQYKQYKNFIPVIDTALFSMAIDRRCNNTATVKKSLSTDKNYSFCSILHTVNSFSHSEPVGRMIAERNISRIPFKKDDKRAAIEL